MRKILLDAGHGLYTSGKQTMSGSKGIVKEWTLNKEVCNHIQALLNDYDVEVKRSDDVTGQKDVSLSDRVKIADNWGADVVISIHHNAGGGTGTEVYYHTNGTAEDKKLASIIAPKLAKSLECRDRGVKHAKFTVLTCKATAVLVEGLFMDTKADYDKMVQSKYQLAYAQAIVESIVEYLDLKPRIVEKPVEVYRVRFSWEDTKSQKGAFSDVLNAVNECKKHDGFSVFNNSGEVVYPTPTFLIKVKVESLNVRSEANFTSRVVATVKKGDVYTITQEQNGLGKLKSGIGWVSLSTSFVERIK